MEFTVSALHLLKSKPLEGKFYRYLRTRYAANPISMRGAMENGGRYNVAGLFGALYLGFDRTTCEAEISDGIAAGVPFKKAAFTIWKYEIELSAIVRLDSAETLNLIGTTIQEITIPGNHWTASSIGEPLYNRGDVEGLVVPSAYLIDGRCLNVFLNRVKQSSYVRLQTTLGTWPE